MEESVEICCPSCGKGGKLIRREYNLPGYGNVLLVSFKCNHCGYKKSDLLYLEFKEPRRLKYKILTRKDLHAKIYRSPYAIIRIPELGIEITPGPASESFITNVEGLLMRVLEKANMITDENPEAEYKLTKIKAAMRGELSFTVIIEDTSGISKIIPIHSSNLIVEKLEKKSRSNNKYN